MRLSMHSCWSVVLFLWTLYCGSVWYDDLHAERSCKLQVEAWTHSSVQCFRCVSSPSGHKPLRLRRFSTTTSPLWKAVPTHHYGTRCKAAKDDETTVSIPSTATAPPLVMIVQCEIDPSRTAEFLELMDNNARKSRESEPGCWRFDVLRSSDNPQQFFFYEVYENAAAIQYHKEQAHYQAWADFKASGGATASVTFKTTAEFLSP